ncbi:hypothetical protein KA075_00015 [Candidatus Saccharibacteria bacterium]|mgnify:CR=1 FL=1|jgi:hypothetical protein|nr:hypothetical protein [Candidatus Saccharibacteria bacterium]
MIKFRNTLYIFSLLILVAGFFSLEAQTQTYAAVNPIDDFCTEVNTSSRYDGEDNTVCDSNVTDKFNDAAGVGFLDKNGFVSRIIKFISFLTGFLAVIFIVVGGLQFTFSGGDAEKTKKAKKMILFALIGVGVTVASNVILRFAISIANG